MNTIERLTNEAIFVPEKALSFEVLAFLKRVGAIYDSRRSTKGYMLTFSYYADNSITVVVNNEFYNYYF